jgi:Secretion system C-terminal sorting domain
MKQLITLLIGVLFYASTTAQCTDAGFDNCGASTANSTNFNNATLLSGTALSVGAKYKFNNVADGVDAVVTIDKMVNATMKAAMVNNPSIDDDAAMDGPAANAASQSKLFAPRIAPDEPLSGSDRRGYVQFSVSFYLHYQGNTLPTAAAMQMSNANFLQFDLDGFYVGSNGWFKETGYIKTVNGNSNNPSNVSASSSSLSSGGMVNDDEGTWLLTMGGLLEKNGVVKCEEVATKSIYNTVLTTVSFRLGYDYKAPPTNTSILNLQPTRDYGIKLSCFTLAPGGPLPLSLINIGANYDSGIAVVSWTTSQESNLAAYEIQRSTNGLDFKTVGTVLPNNLETKQTYKFTDNVSTLKDASIYYRIKIIDRDNTFSTTKILSIKLAGSKVNEMTVSPNPANAEVQLKVKVDKKAVAEIIIVDAAGKIMVKQSAQLYAGSNNIEVNNLSKLSEGFYTIRLVSGKDIYTTKLIISR